MQMKKADLDCLTERHLLLFGKIIHWFARYEFLMQGVMATVTGSDSASIMLLTRGIDFNGKRRALLDLLRHRTIPLDRYDRINAYLMIPHTFAPLRHEIAHSTWIPGSSSSWIQPDWILRVPLGVTPFHGEDFVEQRDDKIAYSFEDLGEAVDTLAANYDNLYSYLHEIGMIRD
jgi:hypothetical protein